MKEMKIMKRICWLVAALVFLFAFESTAQEPPPSAISTRSGYVSLGVAGGFMIDPDMGAGMVSLDYYVTDEVSIGPYAQLGGSGSNSYWGVSGQVKFSAALSGNSSVRPYGTLGIGFVQIDFEDRDDDDMTYLFPVGGGFEFELSDILSLDAGALFNITEDTFGGLVLGVRVLL